MKIGSFGRALMFGSLALLLAANAPVRAQAQDYPNRPIRLIVGFAAGGGNDLFARLVGQKLGEFLGQTLVIENRPAAGGRLAIEFVKNQPADGYTITVAATGQMAIAAAIYPNLPYHPTRDFIPLSIIASFPLILAGPDVPLFGQGRVAHAREAAAVLAFELAARGVEGPFPLGVVDHVVKIRQSLLAHEVAQNIDVAIRQAEC